jgi:hypothetical protein
MIAGTRTIVLAATLSLAACSGPPLEARLDISAALEDDAIVVSGSTNLPDGARIFVYVWHEAETLPFDSENLVTVVNGRYEARVTPVDWPSGVAHAAAGFLLDGQVPQPSHVLQVVGAFGERLGAPLTMPHVSFADAD